MSYKLPFYFTLAILPFSMSPVSDYLAEISRFSVCTRGNLTLALHLPLQSPLITVSLTCQHYIYDTFSVCLQQLLLCYCVTALCGWVSISMEMLKIEQVIVGSGVRSTSAETKPEVVPLQSCKL